MAWRQRNPAGGVALSTGTAIDVTGAAGGVVVVVVAPSVAARTAPTMPVLACLLATATPTAPTATTALAPMTARQQFDPLLMIRIHSDHSIRLWPVQQ
jgi:hypothetical protein